jgi:hypothetical protein
VAGRVATGEPASFAINEWSVAGRVQLTLQQALGLRGSLALGASVFVVSPSASVVVETGTLLAAGFLELSLSRPVWFGRLGVSPSAGVRLFSAERRVRVNDQELSTLPLLAPQASVVLIGRVPL